MPIKLIYYNSLKSVMSMVTVLFVGACASDNGADWPKMEADNLWQELEKKQSEESNPSETALNSDDQSSLNGPLAMPSFEVAPPTLSDIRYSLREIERDLPIHERGINAALLRFKNAEAQDKALHWRGVEIEKSRLNDMESALRRIEYQIRGNEETATEQELVERFMQWVTRISPDMPEDMTTDRLAGQ